MAHGGRGVVLIFGDAPCPAAVERAVDVDVGFSTACGYARQSSPGMMRCIKASNSGTVKAVSPWLGL